MSSLPSEPPGLLRTVQDWWAENRSRRGFLPTVHRFAAVLWEFGRDSTPARRRQRYGDVDYDWDHRVDTTGATVGWHDRLLGMFLSPYQPTEPGLFHEMLRYLNIDYREFTFIDLGSGKGRTLLMAADYPFRRIIGVEVLPELHRIAQENLRGYKSDSQSCFQVESHCFDARGFVFPAEPMVLYLFNPLPESGLVRVIISLHHSLLENPRPAYVLYHNPLLEHVLSGCAPLKKIGGTHQYSVYAAGP